MTSASIACWRSVPEPSTVRSMVRFSSAQKPFSCATKTGMNEKTAGATPTLRVAGSAVADAAPLLDPCGEPGADAELPPFDEHAERVKRVARPMAAIRPVILV